MYEMDIKRGFECPECGNGLVYTKSIGSKLMALTGFSLGFLALGLVVMLNTSILWGLAYLVSSVVSESLANFASSDIFVIALLLMILTLFGVLEYKLFRMWWGSAKHVFRCVSGQRLFPARRGEDNLYRLELNPVSVNFRRGIEHDDDVDGALSLSDSFEDDTKGAISTTSDV